MTSFLHDDDLLMGQLLTPDSIVLTSEQIDWAVELSQQAASEAEQWQTYLNGLALLGLRDWLQKRSPDLVLSSDWLNSDWLSEASSDQSLDQSLQIDRLQQVAPASVAQSVCWVQVGTSRLYLLINDEMGDGWVTLPKSVTKSIQHHFLNAVQTDRKPDFYVLVDVLEELAEVRVEGYLPQANLQAQVAELPDSRPDNAQSNSAQLEHQEEPMELLLPLQAFSFDPDALLLHLRAGSQLDSALAQSPVSQPVPQTVPDPVPQIDTQSSLLPPLINVGLWLNNQLDALAEALTWVLLPPAEVDLSGALRGQSDTSDLNLVIRNLRRDRALVVPTDARVAYHDVTLEGLAARLYALIWVGADQAQWSMLLILGAQPGFPLPRGLRLRVAADEQVLSDEGLEQDPYLYVQVMGDRDEQFQVSLVAPNGSTLPVSDFFLAP